jgi:hypothetical protein
MNFRLATPVLLAALMAFSFTAPDTSWAGGGGKHHYDRHGYSHHQKHHHYKRHHKPGYSYRRYDSDDDEKLLIGLLLGGVFGYALSSASQPEAAPATAYQPPQSPYPAAPYSSGGGASTCLQEREYQMKVLVGGKEADAYGTACLQPDGSWTRGPAHLVSH